MKKLPRIEVGDRIRFKAATRSHHREAWRKVNGFYDAAETMPTVAYHGWSNFAVQPHEILAVEKAAKRVAA